MLSVFIGTDLCLLSAVSSSLRVADYSIRAGQIGNMIGGASPGPRRSVLQRTVIGEGFRWRAISRLARRLSIAKLLDWSTV